MAKSVDKGKKMGYDQSDLLGQKPYGSIGPGRSVAETKLVRKLKKRKAGFLRAKGSTAKSGEKANVGGYSRLMKHFVNR